MNIRYALLAVLATVPSTACRTANCGDPPTPSDAPFNLDEPITAAELDEVIATYYDEQTTWEEVECEVVCSETYLNVRDRESTAINSCTLTLPDNADGSGEPGRVTCQGTGHDIEDFLCLGRRPLGHVEGGDEECGDELGRNLAAMAYLEAASVLAFEQLAASLAEWGAPTSLVQRCQAAARDERRHARWLTMLANQRGAVVPEPTLEQCEQTPFAVALHNAVEGCVHETFAALLAACQAQRASSPTLRRLFTRIAADETRHGQLAWDLHAWLLPRLEADEARVVEAALAQALAQLPVRAPSMARLPVELGAPEPKDAQALATALSVQLAA